jgi:hypothetical protein
MHCQSNLAMILPVGRGWKEGTTSPKISVIVPSASPQDVGPLSIQSSGHSPLIGLRRAGPTTQAIRQQASIHMASTHCGVDLASSNGCKAFGVDSHPIVPHQQIKWV